MLNIRVLASATLLGLCVSACGNSNAGAPGPRRQVLSSPRSLVSSPLAPRYEIIGHSAKGRVIPAWTLGPANSRRRIMVVGCVHGDEAAGIPIALALLRRPPPSNTQLVVVPDVNPDGRSAATRQNARGVDLNRNFPFRWVAAGRRGDQQYPGTGPLSEPESRAVAALIKRVHPTVTVWFHQPVNVVDLSGGSVGIESRFARAAGLPLQQLGRYPGSATGWQNHQWPEDTAFVVELPRPVPASVAERVTRALVDLGT